MAADHFCLKWNSYQSSLTTAFKSLQQNENFVDVTLTSEGQTLRAHKVILSASSPYFRELLGGISPWQHPVLLLSQVPFQDLTSILDFVYLGQVTVVQENLQSFLKSAELLRIRGLTEEYKNEKESQINSENGALLKTLYEDKQCAKRKQSIVADNTLSDHLLTDKRSKMTVDDYSGEVILKQEPHDNSSTRDEEEIEQYKDGGGGDTLEVVGDTVTNSMKGGTELATVNCLVCRATLSNSNALYYHMNYVHSTGVQPMDFIRKISQNEDIVKQEGD